MKKTEVIKKFLNKKSFEKDGFLYTFLDVEDNKEFFDAVNLVVNVTLPKKGQSWHFSHHSFFGQQPSLQAGVI